ncbi:MAG: monofunctional biosynthetic peptidoglycan transglycosylase [Deltaproteobacteria bacterium]|nr:monofunctional biosynthetic peptidoglycan transglycosylase [Deltaproteobacteria bacterium]
MTRESHSPRNKKTKTGKIKRILLILIFIHVSTLLIYKWILPPITVTQFVSVLNGYTLQKESVDFCSTPINLKYAVIASEDQLFAVHNGFDIDSIKKAFEHNKKKQALRGASTISQQVAKNVFLWQGRTWIRKGLEAYYTMAIEIIWKKRRILEIYLNEAETGPGIFGFKAAAKYYFNKDIKNLTLKQSALIAASLPNPKILNPKNPSKKMLKKADWIITQIAYLKTRKTTASLLNCNSL